VVECIGDVYGGEWWFEVLFLVGLVEFVYSLIVDECCYLLRGRF